MKAAQISEYGDVTNITLNDVEIPEPGANQVQVKAAAASLNPFDSAVLAGYAQSMAPLNFPATLGIDFAGTVTAVGEGVTEFKEGDRVYGTANAMFGASGAFAEYVCANTNSIALSPSNVSDVEAASLPTAGISAWQAITKEIGLEKGQKFFVNGGTGGVGTFAIQIAKHLGAHVATTASTENAAYASELGADEVIDYKTQRFQDALHDYDAALDTVGGDSINEVLSVVKTGGAAATMAGAFDEDIASQKGITVTSVMTHVTTQALDELRELVENGAVTTHVDKEFPLDTVAEAYAFRSANSVKGKVGIKIS